jgi:hypothetical protein
VLSRLGSVVSSGRLRLELRTSRTGRLTAGVSVSLRRASAVRRAPTRDVLRLEAVRPGVVETGTHRLTATLSRDARRRLARASSARVSVRVTIGSQSVTVGKLALRR